MLSQEFANLKTVQILLPEINNLCNYFDKTAFCLKRNENFDMESSTEKQSKSSGLGKISLLAGIFNFVLFALFYINVRFYREYQVGLQIIIAALFISLSAGIITGIIALVKDRSWLGFAVNLMASAVLVIALLLLLIIVFYGGYAAAKSLGLLP